MKRLALLLLLLITPAYGQGITSMLPGPGTVHSAGGGAYAGPGDVLAVNSSGSAFSCTRAFDADSKGNPVCNVCFVALGVDVACEDISSNATTGIVDTIPAILGHICCTGFTVKTAYDLSGNGHDVTNATVATRPLLDSVSVGSALFAIKCVGASSTTLSGTGVGAVQLYSGISMVVERTGAFTSFGFAMGLHSGGEFRAGWANSADTGFFTVGSGNFTASGFTDSVVHSVQFDGDATGMVAWIDGTPTLGGNGTSFPNTAITLCNDSGGNFATAHVFEAIAHIDQDITSDEPAMTANQLGFY